MSAATEVNETTEAPKAKRFREGVVVKNKMNKTVIVEITRLTQHAQFKKTIRRKIRYAVHDEKNESKAGDKVRILQTRPLSKTKRWTLIKVLPK